MPGRLDAIVSEELAKKFASEKETPYTRWLLKRAWTSSAPSMSALRHGGAEALRGAAAVGSSSATTPPAPPTLLRLRDPVGVVAPQRQLFEEMILVLDGRGSTSVWNDAGKKVSFEWQKGSLFAIPLNAWHQHFNGSGSSRHATSPSPTARR